jgi:hypothetical protein
MEYIYYCEESMYHHIGMKTINTLVDFISNPEEVESHIKGAYDDATFKRESDFIEDFKQESERFQLTIKIVLAMKIYMQAYPHLIKESDEHMNQISRFLYRANVLHVVNSPEVKETLNTSIATNNGKCMHFRNWCFKTLRHERYKRNSDGSARVIFCKPTWVNSKSNTKVVLEGSEEEVKSFVKGG